MNAVEPGGSGDIYASLDKEQRDVLAEATRLGFPVQGWFNYRTIGMGAFPILFEAVVQKDPTYFEDFWKVPGYAGAGASAAQSRRQKSNHPGRGQRRGAPSDATESARDLTRQQLQSAPVGFEIDSVPSADLELATVMVRTGDAAGASFLVGKVDGHRIFVGGSAAMMAGGTGSDALKRINPGDEAQIDNSNFLAVQYYHRHQVPTPDSYVWDQFRASDGRPLYPQRPKLIGPEFAASAGGTLQSGRFEGKMIVIESLWDQDAFPWQADWYASKVKAALGSRFDENFRLWFIDHALHGDVEKQFDSTHTVSYVGALQQALRDLSAWVEKGVTPPASTTYRIVDGQVQVPPTAAERRGIQPVVALKADGSARAEVAVGQPVTLSAVIDTPADAGRVVAAEWDMEGTGDFSPAEFSRSGVAAGRPRVEAKHTYSTPATYFTVLRVTSQRQGDLKSPYAQIHNLARVRVVVR